MRRVVSTSTVLVMLFFGLFAVSITMAQVATKERVEAKSWSRGESRINEREIRVSVRPNEGVTEIGLFGESCQQYMLRVVPQYYTELETPHWKIELRRVKKLGEGSEFGDDLLFVERPGTAGDYFPAEDQIAVIFPDVRKARKINGELWVELKKRVYSPELVRLIRVQGFVVKIDVSKTVLSEENGEFLYAELLITLENTNDAESK